MNVQTLLFGFFAFAVSSVIVTLFFSGILEDYAKKDTLRRNALLLTFSGTLIGVASSILASIIPSLTIFMDMSVVLIFLTWTLLLRCRFNSDTSEALVYSFMAILIYALVLVLTSGFFMLIWIGAT